MALMKNIPPTPPANMIAPYGSTAPFNPQWQSFLPADPNAMAGGLTPEMLAGIQRPPGFTPPAFAPPPLPPQANPRARLAQMMMRRPQNVYPQRGQGAKNRASGGSDRGGYGGKGLY